jgi:hypothetical protein
MYSVTYEIKQGDTTLPIIFVTRRELIAYATENNITNYQIITDTDRP